jgi:hypothetical protein
LGTTEQFEDYSTRFEFELKADSTLIDIAGGLLNPGRDRLPGIDHDAYSVRRGMHLVGSDYAVDWISIDGRVSRLRLTPDDEPVVFSNVVNNFPQDWNRWEPNEAKLRYRYALRGQSGSPDVNQYTRFAWSESVPVAARYTWLRSSPTEESYLAVDGDVVVTAIRREGDHASVRLFNPDTRHGKTARISSDSFLLLNPEVPGPWEAATSIEVALLPGEARSVILSTR